MKHPRIPLLLLAVTALAGVAGACGGAGTGSVSPSVPEVIPTELRACHEDLGLSSEECAAVVKLALPATLPPARGNKYADNEAAAQLGFRLFFDSRFTTLQEMRCATCHLPENSFGDSKPVAMGTTAPLPRNSPTLLTTALMQPVFWDGRADSLWSQPLFALENPEEMNSSRLELAHAIYASVNREGYEAIFGALPALADVKRFPPRGKPGEPEFDKMAPADQDAVNGVAANVGKTLEAYMRKLTTGRTGIDLYLSGEREAASVAEKRGLATFVKAKCIDCHSGPAMSDGKFHDMRVPALPGAAPDRGRAKGLEILAANIFNAQGPFFDRDGDVPAPPPAATPADEGAFRTPTLRNVSRTAPYGHNGFYPTLESLLAAHGDVKLDADQTNSLMVFLLSLNGTYPSLPWSGWPAR